MSHEFCQRVVESFRRGAEKGLNAQQVQLVVTLALRGDEEVVHAGMVRCVTGMDGGRLQDLGGRLERRGLVDRTAGEWKLTALGVRVAEELVE